MMSRSKLPELSELGFHPSQLKLLRNFSIFSGGAVVICGTLGSGKSSTLRAIVGDACLSSRQGAATIAIVGGDDFPDIENARITRLNESGPDVLKKLYSVKSKIVVFDNFEAVCDYSVVGKMVATGRKVFLTLNSLSAIWVFEQMAADGISRNLLGLPGFVSGVVCQQVFPALCPECSISVSDTKGALPEDTMYRVQHVVDFGTDNVRTKGPGCPACGSTGYAGQTVVAEFLMPDVRMLRMVAEGRISDYCEYWKSSNLLNVDGIGITLLSHAISKVRRGVLDPVDVERRIGPLTLDLVMADSALVPTELGMLIGSGSGGKGQRPELRQY